MLILPLSDVNTDVDNDVYTNVDTVFDTDSDTEVDTDVDTDLGLKKKPGETMFYQAFFKFTFIELL